jgi:hypothetical protein
MTLRIYLLSISTTSLLFCSMLSVQADTLRCQSVNGNTNCAGTGSISCQTVNGRTVCASKNGDVVQSFGGQASPDSKDAESDDDSTPPARHQRFDMTSPRGQHLSVTQDGSSLHIRSGSILIDRD